MRQANRVKYHLEDSGSLPAYTDGSTLITGKDGRECVVEVCPPSSQDPYPLLETGGNSRANEGATAYQKTPRSRLHPAISGGLRSMARPVSAHVPTVGGHPVFGRLRFDRRYRVRHKRIPRSFRTPNTPDPRFKGRRVAHEPSTPRRERKLSSGADGTPRRLTKESRPFRAERYQKCNKSEGDDASHTNGIDNQFCKNSVVCHGAGDDES